MTEDKKVYYLCRDGKCFVRYTGSRELAQAYADEQGLTLKTTRPTTETSESETE